MGARAKVIAVLVVLAALSRCAPERGELAGSMPSHAPTASDRAAEARGRIAGELSDLEETPAAGGQKSELQSRVLEAQSKIASLSADLQTNQANVAAESGLVESQSQKEATLRREQMREISASIRMNDVSIQSMQREIRIILWPTGETYEGNSDLNSLRVEVARMQEKQLELRSSYAAIADEDRSAAEASRSAQQSILLRGQQRQSDLAASITAAKAELSQLEQQSKELDTAAAARKQRADQLRAELAKVGG